MNQEELKQRLIELLDELYKRERIVSFEQIAETFIANGVTIRERGEWCKITKLGTPVNDGYVSSCCDMWNNRKSHYCPHCGANMRGGKDE